MKKGLVVVAVAVLSLCLGCVFAGALTIPRAFSVSTPTPTRTLVPTFTPTPQVLATSTPKPVTIAPQTSLICSKGWTEFKGRGIRLCLPEEWKVGSDDEEQIAATLQPMKGGILFWAFDPASFPFANILVKKDPTGVTVPQYMEMECQRAESYFEQVGATARCTEISLGTLGNYRNVGRILLEESISGKQLRTAQYLMKQGKFLWLIALTADSSQFKSYLSVVERAISSMKIDDKESYPDA